MQEIANTQAFKRLILEQQRQAVMLEEMHSDIKKILEILGPVKKREERFGQTERRVENHDHRISLLDVTVKDRVVEHDRP